nr:nucleotidyltransferase family protein [uncultured Pseudoxanthomonas sp.]
MKALIFAAGLGERMRPLTDHTPKPLIEAGGKPLIVWHLEKLAAMGVQEVVINTSWLADRFPAALGDGARWGLRIHYLYEGDTPLETGGGMLNARTLLGETPFLLVNGDIWTDFDFTRLPREPAGLAHLALVPPPAFAPRGDFALDSSGLLHREGGPRVTYAGLGVYRPALLDDWPTHAEGQLRQTSSGKPRFPLLPLLHAAMAAGNISGELLQARWTDVGTPERLADLNRELSR